MIDKSFLILRANPSLSGNVKLVVSSTYQLYLESYNANQTLMQQQFKHFSIQNSEYWKEVLPAFFKNTDNSTIFNVRNINDISQTYTDYRFQFDDTYFCGAQFTEDNYYTEEFEYSAPLFLKRTKLPTDFIILRVDGYSSTEDTGDNNFRSNIINNFKFVTSFDLTTSSSLGNWIEMNFINDNNLPSHSVIINNDEMVLSQFTGVDLINSGWTTKSLNLFETQSLNTPIFKTEDDFSEIWKNNNIIYPDIINFKFLFDDVPATPTSLRNYSINRYLGFYVDNKNLLMSISPFKTFDLNITPFDVIETLNSTDAREIPFIKNNTFVQEINGRFYSFDPIHNGWIDGNTYWVEWNTNYYNIQKVPNSISNPFQLDIIIGDFLYQIITPINIKRSIDDILKNDNVSLSFINSLSQDDLSIAQRVLINDLGFDYPTGTTYKNRITITNQINFNNIIGYNIIENSDTTLIQFQRNYQFNTINGIKSLYFTITIQETDNTFNIPNFEEADLYLIQINNKYYVLKQYESKLLNIGNKYYINSDYAINIDSSNITNWINNGNITLDNNYYSNVNIENITLDNTIPFFNIYRINFSEVKDFDFDRIETNYTRYEYEQKYSLEQNTEPKFYAKEYRQNPYNVYTISGDRARRIPIVDENNRPLNIRDQMGEINYITNKPYINTDLYYTDLDGTSWQLLDETLNGTTWSKYSLTPLNLSRGYYREENYIWRLDDNNGNLLGLLNFVTNTDKESIFEALTWGINNKSEISDIKIPVPPINSVDPNEQVDNNFIPVSSEYINSDELWELNNNDLTDIWNKNQSIVKWGALNSLGSHDYSYRLNYSLDFGIYNNNPNPNTNRNFPDRTQQNLDFFYRFNLLNKEKYQYYTLHLNSNYFNIDSYLGIEFDYFESLFKSDQITSEGIEVTNKYSTFLNINNFSDSETIFRGVKYLLSDVNNIIFDQTELQQTGKIIIDDIITTPNIKYSDYKFSIIFGKKMSTFTNNYVKGTGNSNMGIDIYLNDYWKNVIIHLYIDTDDTIQLVDPNTNQFVNAETSTIDLWYEDINDTSATNPTLWDNLEFKINNYGINLRPRNFKLLDIINLIQNRNFDPMGEINIEKINFIHIYDNGTTGLSLGTSGNVSIKVMNWQNTDFVLSTILPSEIIVKEKAFITTAVDNSLIPTFNINNSLSNRLIREDTTTNSYFTTSGLSVKSVNDINCYNGYPIAKNINPNTLDTRLSWQLDTNTDPSIYRYNGVYAPIFKNIPLFRPLMYNELNNNSGKPILSSGNWKFYDSNSSTTLPNIIGFGELDELLFSKCNSNTSILQIQDPTNKDKSVYPMTDEYGYDFDARFIFASSFEPSYNYLSRNIYVPENPSVTLGGYTIHYDGVNEYLRISDQEKFNQENYLINDCNYNNYSNNFPTGEKINYNVQIPSLTNSNNNFSQIINIIKGVDYYFNFNYESFPIIGQQPPPSGESNVHVNYTFNFISPTGTLYPAVLRDSGNNVLTPPNTPNTLFGHDFISTLLYLRFADNNSIPTQYSDFNTFSLQITLTLETILQFPTDELIMSCNIQMLTSSNFLDIETDNYYLLNNTNNTLGNLLFGSFIKLNSEPNNIWYYPANSNINSASTFTIPQLNNYDVSNLNILGQKLWLEFAGISVNKRPGRIGIPSYNYTSNPIPTNWSGYIYIDILNRLRAGAGTYLLNAIINNNNYGWNSYADPNNIFTSNPSAKFDRCCLYHFLEYGSQPTPENVVVSNLSFGNSKFGASIILNEFYKMTGFTNFFNRNFTTNFAYNIAPNESVGIMRITNPNNFTFEPDRTSYLLDGKKASYIGQPSGVLTNPYVILQWTMNFRDTKLSFNIIPQNGNIISVSIPLINPTTNINYNFNDILNSLNKILAPSAYIVKMLSTIGKQTIYKILSSVDGSYYNFEIVLLSINDFTITNTNNSQSIIEISEKFTKTSLRENRRTGRITATTVEFWLQISSWERSYETILYKGDDSGSDGWLDTSFKQFTYIIGKFADTDKLAFKTCHENLTGGYTTHILSSTLELNDNNWHHIVCTSDMLTMTKQIWIDGELDNQTINFLEELDSNGNIIDRTPQPLELLAQFVERRNRFIPGIQNPSMTFDNILANKIRMNSQDSVTQYWINVITGVYPAKYVDLQWQYNNWSTTIDVAFQEFSNNYIALNYYLNVDANTLNWDILLGTDSTINNGNRNFEGFIDELRVWNYARSGDQIQQTWRYKLNPNSYYDPLNSLVSYFRFDEGQGFNQLTDLTNNKIVQNMIRWTANSITYINNGRKLNEIDNTKYFYFIDSYYPALPIIIDDTTTDWDVSGAIILGIIDERSIPQSPTPITTPSIREKQPVIFNNTKNMLLKRRLSRIMINIKTTIFNYTTMRTFQFTPIKWWLFKTIQTRVQDSNQSSQVKIQIERTGSNWLTQISNLITKKRS